MSMFKFRTLLVVSGVVVGLVLPAAAGATITQVFGSVTCTMQTSGATAGQRWCGNTAGTTVPTWDGTPIDISVAFPAATSPDNDYPVVGVYHPWGSTKILPSSATAQRWLTQGYAVFSMSDRGWGSSCGSPSKPANTLKAAPCEAGYIHLISRKYEVRDAQYLLGLLAEEGLINPQEIGATGGSYGGGMSAQLGSMNNRVEMLNGELVPWTTKGGTPMKIAATAPEYPWTDLAQALEPNGSWLDYVTNAPYSGVLGNHEFGIEKRSWNESLYLAGAALGYYAPTSLGEPEANNTEWYNFNQTGGPYNGQALAIQQEEQLPNHGAYYTNLSVPPAPSIMENGWNDDLFPANQSVDYYNKVRAAYPNQPIELFDFDLGHNPRSASTPSAADDAKLTTAQNEWFKYFVKGEGSEPANAHGGVTAISSHCPATSTTSGTEYKAADWAALAPGEVHLEGAAEQTIQAPGIAPKTTFTSGTICTTEVAGENSSAATYKLAPAPSGGFTIAGATTVVGEFSTPGTNDQVIARLMDVNEAEGGTQQLVGRAIYRPINPGGGFTKQIFQLYPQVWNVAAGHVLKLQLMVQDSSYARTSTSPQSIQVKNLELRVPTIEKPGSDGGLVQTPLPKYLPPGYTLARDVTPAAPGTPHLSSGSATNANGVFTLAWGSTQAAAELTYTLQQKNAGGGWETLASGLRSPEYAFTAGSPESEGTWTYRVSAGNEGPASEYSAASAEVKVDETAPNAPSAVASRAPDYAPSGGWYKDSVEVSFTGNGDPALSDGSAGSGVNPATLPSPQAFETSGSHTACGTATDNVGNVSTSGCLIVQVDATPPSLEITCPASVAVGTPASADYTAFDAQSGLASVASGTVPIDTSSAGEKTVSTTAVDNVGNETSRSCSTQVGYADSGAPTLSAGSSPSANGLYTLAWTGSDPMQYLGLSYTLQHHSAASATWSTVASGIEALSYQFTGAGEEGGTWVYRVQGSDPSLGETTEWSPASAPVVVDETPPNSPSVMASRAPDYAGGGGWYKDSVTVSFASAGDPTLADGSPGSGVNAASISAPQTFDTSGAHTASASVSDNAGNVSTPGSLMVQVDATPPSLEITCPTSVALGAAGVVATVSADDGQSGLASNPSGIVPIDTGKAGPQTVTRTAVDNVGHETTRSCTTEVGYTKVITAAIKGKLVVKSGEAVELTSTAKAGGTVTVKPGGALDVEGAALAGSLSAGKATLVRVCGASVSGAVKVSGASGSVVLGEGTAGCSADTFYGTVNVSSNTAGVSIFSDTFHGSLKVKGNASGATVTDNLIAGSLLVKGNIGTVVDEPNEVEGSSKLQ
jgi:dienelactone hydrolase